MLKARHYIVVACFFV